MTDKYEEVAGIISRSGALSVLDVGCRDCILRRSLVAAMGTRVDYTGLDLNQNEQQSVDIVCDLTAGIPATDGSYDIVVGLDVLEHLDDLQGGLDELLRVAKSQVLMVLPNCAHFIHRTSFFIRGRLATGKYDLAVDMPQDRHRWLTVVPQIDEFIDDYCRRHGLVVSRRDLSGGRRTGYVERLLRAVGFNRSWHVFAVLYVLIKPDQAQGD